MTFSLPNSEKFCNVDLNVIFFIHCSILNYVAIALADNDRKSNLTDHFCKHKQFFRLCFCIMLSFALENEDEKLAYPTMVIGILWTVGRVFRAKNFILIF